MNDLYHRHPTKAFTITPVFCDCNAEVKVDVGNGINLNNKTLYQSVTKFWWLVPVDYSRMQSIVWENQGYLHLLIQTYF